MTQACGGFLIFAAPNKIYAILSLRWRMATETVTLGESGRIMIPASIRQKYALKPGDRLTVSGTPDAIRIQSRQMALEQVRAAILAKRGTMKGLLDEFLEERREEARREAPGE